jgi:hypothetical protein
VQSGRVSFLQLSRLKGEEVLPIASFITSELMNRGSVASFCFIYAEVALDAVVTVVASLSDLLVTVSNIVVII